MRKNEIIREIVNIRNNIQEEIDSMPGYGHYGKKVCLKKFDKLLEKIYSRKKK